jgi:hypothetical protein
MKKFLVYVERDVTEKYHAIEVEAEDQSAAEKLALVKWRNGECAYMTAEPLSTLRIRKTMEKPR